MKRIGGQFARTAFTSWFSISWLLGAWTSKALLALSLSAFVVSRLSDLNGLARSIGLAILPLPWTSEVAAVGGLIFLLAIVIGYLSKPPEFTLGDNRDKTIEKVFNSSELSLYLSRVAMLDTHMKNHAARPAYIPLDTWMYAENVLARANACTTTKQQTEMFETNAKEFYQADLDLRSFQRPCLRLLTTFVMLVGGAGIVTPLIANVVGAINDMF